MLIPILKSTVRKVKKWWEERNETGNRGMEAVRNFNLQCDGI